ncbi:hypothetical protein DM02DRAFT_404480 [Periconia macrospinosa]|uniref:Uncharacterized protein n=1 Tax=Periconia macrospinosa TaxID=97972 RepID=A0A2V1E9C4_9PLEO|nr:hypothetical protein DM02DRAFT_404480 [Periconia macrospinosa]
MLCVATTEADGAGNRAFHTHRVLSTRKARWRCRARSGIERASREAFVYAHQTDYDHRKRAPGHMACISAHPTMRVVVEQAQALKEQVEYRPYSPNNESRQEHAPILNVLHHRCRARPLPPSPTRSLFTLLEPHPYCRRSYPLSVYSSLLTCL